MTDIAPGWYKDPADPTTQRYWDGEGWLGEAIPADAEPPAEPPAAAPAAVVPQMDTVLGPQRGPVDSPVRPDPAGRPAVGAPPPFPQTPAALRYAIASGLLPPPRPHGMALAPVSARFVARMIDIFVVLGLNIAVNGWFVVQYVRELLPVVDEIQQRILAGEPATNVDIPSRVGWLQVAILGIATALWFAYEVPSIASNGQTLGKRLMRIKVMRIESEEPLGIRRAWRRWNPLGLPSLLWSCYGLGFLLQAADLLAGVMNRPLHLAIHDRSAGTIVVQVGPPTSPPDASIPPQKLP